MIKVLIAEDQILFRDLLEHMLESCEDIHVVACIQNGCDILSLAKIHEPDVILMDLDMPVCNGIEATKALKRELTQTKVLVLTASSDEASVIEMMISGADGYLLKSITKNDLILAVKSVYSGMEVIHKDVRQHAMNATSSSALDVKHRTKIRVNDIDVMLSAREIEIIQKIVEGKETPEIAKDFFVAEGRLRNIITEILSKLMLKNRTQLAVFAIKHKLVK